MVQQKSRNECCGFFVAPFPSGRTRTSRKRSCSSRGDWSLNMLRRSIFLTRPLMVHQSTRCKKLQRVFLLLYFKKARSGAPLGDENRAAARSAVRNATVRRSLARGRVPGNVAGVERRGDGERQGLEIKKVQVCKSVYGNNKFDGSLLRNF